MARFRTTVRYVPRTRQLVLVGGGDPFLASSPRKARVSYPDRSDVVTLARKVVRKLRATKVARVRLGFDDSYFTGPAVNPAWPATLPARGRGAADQLAVGGRGAGPRRVRLRRRSRGRRRAGLPLCAPRRRAQGRPAGAPDGDAGRRDRGRRGLERSAGRDRRTHPGGQRQPGRRGAGPSRRSGRAAGGVVPGRRRVGPRGARGSRRTRHRQRAVRRQRALAPEPADHRLARRRAPARGQPGPPRAACGAHRPAGRGVHGVAGLPLRQGSGRRTRPRPGEDGDAHRGPRPRGHRRRHHRRPDGVRPGGRPGASR